jgi:hypothetical protein
MQPWGLIEMRVEDPDGIPIRGFLRSPSPPWPRDRRYRRDDERYAHNSAFHGNAAA